MKVEKNNMKSFQKYLKENEDMRGIVTDAADVVQGLKDISKEFAELQKRYEQATGHRTTDFLHFKSMVDEIISTDNGEAGLEPFVDALFQETAAKDGAEEQWDKRPSRYNKPKNAGNRSQRSEVDDDDADRKYNDRAQKRYGRGSGSGLGYGF